ncbi:MAG: hypothetical protein FWH10_03355 [Oscillospiraceae bacterium]|nr:hypothetical protein [Oscillospiraceae bacterium]
MLKIYIDICCYNRPFDDQSQMKIRLETEAKLYIQAAVKDSKYLLVWSYMLDFENSNSPYEDRQNSVALWKNIAHESCLSSVDVLLLGKEIMKFGIKEMDSLHIACAITNGCDYFITTDKRLLNKTVTEIKIINPVNFVLETEENPNEN